MPDEASVYPPSGGGTVRVVITGSHGVGKTTLAASLLASGRPGKVAVVPETARLLAAEGFAVNDRMTLNGFLRYIRLFSENARRAAGDLVLLDRSLVDLHVYTRELRSLPATAHDLLLELIRHELRLVDFYVMVPIEFGLVADGVRPTDDAYRRVIDEAVRHFLRDMGAPTMEVTGSVADRTRQVVERIERGR